MGSKLESGFWISLVVTASFIFLLFKFRSKNNEPAKLNLKASLSKTPNLASQRAQVPEVGPPGFSKPRRWKREGSTQSSAYGEEIFENLRQDGDPSSQNFSNPHRSKKGVEGAEKVLNVFFIFNGHSWDAYEVLGVPPGSSLARCEQAYQKALTEVADDSREFVDLAWEAIRKNHGL
jgi:hypothetical protein